MNLNPLFKLNGILHKNHARDKQFLPNPIPGLKLVFKKDAMITIKRAKGWHTDREMAEALGVTRAYVSMLAARRVSASHNIILRLAYLLGNIHGNWWVFYEIIDSGEPVDSNHPIWNQEKYEGKIPYTRFSSSAELRNKDYKTEHIKKTLDK